MSRICERSKFLFIPFAAILRDMSCGKRVDLPIRQRIALTAQRIRELRKFVLVGGAAAVAYFVLAFLLERIGTSAVMASLSAYAALMPISYLGHRKHTFCSKGRSIFEIPKFIVVSLVGLASGALVPHLIVGVLGMPAWIGFIAVCVVAPLGSYAALRLWVFRETANRP